MLQKPLRRKRWTVLKFLSGLRGSKEEKWALKIILILGARQQVVPTRMSKKFEKKSTRIVGTQLSRYHKLQVWAGVPVSGFWLWIWTETRCREVCSLAAHTGPKITRLTLCQELKNQIESDPDFLSKVIAGNESWCYCYDPEIKQASSQWKTPNSPRPKKARQVRSNVKKMLIVFLFFFSMFEESCTGNSFLLDRLSIMNFTWRFWGDWERMCEENAQNCGDRVIGFSIITTPQLIQLCLWPVICPLWDGPSFPTHPIHRT